MPGEAAALGGYAGSASCRECHLEAWREWTGSHHGLAERPPREELDRAAFEPAQTFSHGTQTTSVRWNNGGGEATTPGFGGERRPFRVERVIGNDPLRQFLVAGDGGRWHALEACWDPRRREWFNVYGSEDRRPGEWGHWTGRGMVWNQMCASCHNTRLRKNYDALTDGYRTTMAEASVGCEACHGPMKSHVAWQSARPAAKSGPGGDPTLPKFTRDQVTENCAGCHARRSELTGDFVPGEPFWDHYQLTVPDHSGTYHPDGQVRDENYEFASFLGSRMHHAGVRCLDCHSPHAAKPVLPGNLLCLRCHVPGGFPKAPPIVPETHSFHKADSAGSLCVNCHMPQTTYMQRHARHDHGFTIPDPLLTKQFQVPNACNRCHADRDTDWALAAADKWWGSRLDRKTRRRAQAVAEARLGREEAREPLLALLSSDEVPAWKASALLLLERWVGIESVNQALLAQARHEHPLVRAAAARLLEPLAAAGHREAAEALQSLLRDQRRVVRIAAAWSLRASLDESTAAGRDLLHMLAWNADQPAGQMQLGQYHSSRGNPALAISHLETAVRWDSNSPPFHRDLALAQAAGGDTDKAVASLLRAVALAPTEAAYHFELGLIWNEAGSLDNAIVSLSEAARLDPGMGRAWYNLGLACHARGEINQALDALRNGESAAPGDAAIPYARATILAQMGRVEEAREAAGRALRIQPGHSEAARLQSLLSR